MTATAPAAGTLTLPPIRDDLALARSDLEEYGVTRVADALDPAEIRALRRRTEEQAAAERALGLAFLDGGGANQRVWNLPSKGQVFLDLLTKPMVDDLIRPVLGGDYCLSSHTANITGPGGESMLLHTDQGYAPRSIDLPLAMNILWMLVDFTDENGGTRVVPGTHRSGLEPPGRPVPETVAATGPAGTALVFDGRVWHGTGANRTTDQQRWAVLTYFVRPWIRPQENFTLSTVDEVARRLTPHEAELLGFRVWRTLGGVQGPWGPGTPDQTGYRTSRIVDRDEPLIGELRPGVAETGGGRW